MGSIQRVDRSKYLKTDGERLIIAFKIEAGSPTKKWLYFEYGLDATDQLSLVRRV